MYNKLFAKILDSSIWLEPTTTRIVWITLLAAMDQDGYAHFSAVQNLADRAKVSLAECKKAIAILKSPDKNSGDPDHEGRRIERVPGGFIVLNASKYRDMLNKTVQREQTRIRVAKHRAKRGVTVSSVTRQLQNVTPVTPLVTVTPVTPSEADTEAEAGGEQHVNASKQHVLNKTASPPPKVNGADKVVWDRELSRVSERMKAIRDGYSEHQNWSADDRAEWGKLLVRRNELRSNLGVMI